MLYCCAILLAVAMIPLLISHKAFELNSLRELEALEKSIDPNFDNHSEEWDYFNNNYTVFVHHREEDLT